MISKSSYTKLLKDHVKLKTVKSKQGPEVLSENEKSIISEVKIKSSKRKITSLTEKFENCKNKKDLITLEMMLKKEKAKLKTLEVK